MEKQTLTPANIARGILASTVFTLNDRQISEGKQAHALGLTDMLPAGHPYKSVAP